MSSGNHSNGHAPNPGVSGNTPNKQAPSSSVASIVRDNFQTHNRDFATDKSTLITSLNYNLSHLNSSNAGNSTGSASSNPSSGNLHTYQNVSQFKQIQNLLQSTLNGHQGGSAGGGVKVAPPVPPPPPSSSSTGQNLAVNIARQNGSSTNAATTAANVTNGCANATSAGTALTKTKNLDGYVGFANLPNQVYRKAVKKGFEFNLMVIGESGLGKSTFINSLFLAELYNAADFPGTFERRKKTTFIDSTTVLLTEKGVNLRLTVVDTPGYGESIDNSNCWQPLVDHIDCKYEEYLNSESKINRKLPINDQRVHCCLHFIAPGHTYVIRLIF